MKYKIKTNQWALVILFSAIPVFVLGFYCFCHAVNMPFMDDMELVYTVNDIQRHPDQIFHILTRQQNDHRSFLSRAAALLIYAIEGKLDFKMTILLGYLNLILLAISILLIIKSREFNPSIIISLFYLLFTPFIFPVHLWSMAAYQYTLSIALSFLALYFLQDDKKRIWYLAIPLAAMASLAFLDGIATFLILLLWLLIQKRWKDSMYLAAFTVSFFLCYFSDFRLSAASNILPLKALAITSSVNFIAFTGSFAKILSDTYAFEISFITGCLVLFFFFKVISQRIYQYWKNPEAATPVGQVLGFLELAFMRLLASAFMISVGRTSEGPGAMVAPRYNIYSISLLVLTIILISYQIRGTYRLRFQIGLVVTSVLFCFYSYLKYDGRVKLMEAELKSDSYNYTHNRVFFHQYFNLPDPEPHVYKNYDFPVYFSDSTIGLWKENIKKQKQHSSIAWNAVEVNDSRIYKNYIHPVIEITLKNIPDNVPQRNIYLGMLNLSRTKVFYLIALRDLSNNGLKRLLKKNEDRKLSASIPNKFRSGRYSMGLCWMADGSPVSLALKKQLITPYLTTK